MKRLIPRLVCTFMLSLPMLACASSELFRLSLGDGALQVEVAATQAQRAQGLMNRSQLDASRGMLFVYPVPAYFCMWMKNTLIPLSVAFIDAQGRVINIADMVPQTETNHCTRSNATYALEANQGWFARHGVQPGTQVIGLEKIPKGEY
jgi:uncharacterized membrane protein (UPF0127 family)